MRIAVVGPVYPYKGGIAQHTGELAARLRAAGHEVTIESWLRQYPTWLYPGQQTIAEPEAEPFTPVERLLAWNRPDSWWRTGRRLRDRDLVVIAHVTPVQVPALLVLLRALERAETRTVVICHNVLPHERRPWDMPLVRRLLRAADTVVVHSAPEAERAAALTSSRIVHASLPAFLPSAFGSGRPEQGEHRRLLFFGLVRPYKGLDVLLRALSAGPPGVELRVAGEFWDSPAQTEALCHELGIVDRVELRPGYVAARQVAALFADVDALVLPYRHATGSHAVAIAHHFGVPVIATRVGSFAEDVHDGIDGLLVEPDDVQALAAALAEFYQPGRPEAMRAQVRDADPGVGWDRYLAAVTGDGGDGPPRKQERSTWRRRP